MNPNLTVLMTVYNGEAYLRIAMDSILQQTYFDFCFLIIDDASTDSSREIVRTYKDERIQLVCLDQNVGQTAALNIGLRRASTTWIARMDADDYSAPTRLEEQMQALDADPSLSCVGTHVWMFRDDPQIIDKVIATPLHHADIERMLLRGTPMIHGSIIVNRDAILDVGAFDEHFRLTSDVDMYDRLLPKYTVANIPSQLLGVRQHENQSSHSKVVFDESIEICSRRLMTSGFSHQDAVITRANLARSHLFRARIFGREHKYMEMGKDISRGFRRSPQTFFWHFLSIFVVRQISERNRSKLRSLLTRRAPKLVSRI